MSNKMKVRLLRAARKRIELGLNGFICEALDDAGGAIPRSYAEVHDLRRLIRNRLDGFAIAETWLSEKHDLDLDHDQMREWRLQWIDKLIEEFS